MRQIASPTTAGNRISKKMFHRLFSGLIYVLVVVDTMLILLFFFRLSSLQEPTVGFYDIGISLWADCFGWICFIILSAYLHYHQYDFESDFSSQFGLDNPGALKIIRLFFCHIIPIAIVVGMFRNAVLLLCQL